MPRSNRRPALRDGAPNGLLARQERDFLNKWNLIQDRNRQLRKGCGFCGYACFEALQDDFESIVRYMHAFRNIPRMRRTVIYFGFSPVELILQVQSRHRPAPQRMLSKKSHHLVAQSMLNKRSHHRVAQSMACRKSPVHLTASTQCSPCLIEKELMRLICRKSQVHLTASTSAAPAQFSKS